MSRTLKIGTLEVCEICLKGKSLVYDFNKRCFRARHVLNLPKAIRKTKYQKIYEKKGREYTGALISDVQAIYQLQQSEQETA